MYDAGDRYGRECARGHHGVDQKDFGDSHAVALAEHVGGDVSLFCDSAVDQLTAHDSAQQWLGWSEEGVAGPAKNVGV